MTPLMFAARFGHRSVVKVLITAGASVNARNDRGVTPLMEAAGVSDVMRDSNSLRRVRPNAEEVKEGHVDAVRQLLAAAADPNARDLHGATALMFAAFLGRAAIVQMLLDKGADAQVKDRSGNTALTYATSRNNVSAVQSLKKAGAKE
jgi:ankyrin repeat protein